MASSPFFVDPEISIALADFPPFVFDDETLPIVRELIPPAERAPDDIDRVDHDIDDRVVVSVHRPREVIGALPCIYWIHGGGLVAGHRHMDNAQLERWCRTLSCTCISVEYRLAPEHHYPAALDDCWNGLEWVMTNAASTGVDETHVGLGGRSAGGGLAAAVAMRARNEGRPALAFMYLEYPMLDDRQRTASIRLDDLPIWNRESNAFGWRSYLGDRAGTEMVPDLAAPARAEDLHNLPSTCVTVGGADGLRDEDVAFADRLMRAGVPTELHVYAGAPHGFHLFADAAVTQTANRDVDDWLGRQLRG